MVGQIWAVGYSLLTSGLYSLFKSPELLPQTKKKKKIQLLSSMPEIPPLIKEGNIALHAKGKGCQRVCLKVKIFWGEGIQALQL